MNSEDPRIIAGLAAQTRTREAALAAGAVRLGWKAGVGTAAAMEKVGTTAPLVGFLTGATRVPDGGEVAISGWANPKLEAELAIRLGSPLPPGASHAQAFMAIDAIGPAIELVDLGAPDDVEAVLAGNIFHRAVLVGELGPAPLDAARLEVGSGDGEPTTGIDPTGMLGDLVDVVRGLADQLPLAGTEMQAGDVIITGAANGPLAIAAGQRITVTLAGAGSVSVRIA